MFALFMTLSALSSSSAVAGDVLVPTFTPKTMGDFAPSEQLTADTMSALTAEGIDFVTPVEIQRRAGEVADGCAERTDCTTTLWSHFPGSSLAVVGSVTFNEGMLADGGQKQAEKYVKELLLDGALVGASGTRQCAIDWC